MKKMSLCIESKFLLVSVLVVHRSSKVICSLSCIKFQNLFECINIFFVYTKVYIHNVFYMCSVFCEYWSFMWNDKLRKSE